MKKLLSILLAVLMVVSVVPMSASAEESITYSVGDIVEFGSYPQSKVTDETLIAELNALAPEWEDWTSYEYYSGTGVGTMTKSDWMRYTDIIYNDNKYRAVRFTQYRPWHTYLSPSDNSEQAENGYTTNTIYWFKFEPIKWRVLDPSTGLVLCETIIDSQPYSNSLYINDSISNSTYCYFNDSSYTNYACDYETSSIRKWLNDNFYNVAFTAREMAEIDATTLNNIGYYTSVGTEGFEVFDSNETTDKIFLLSYNEARNSNFGFSSDRYEHDVERRTQGSDYAKSQGLLVYDQSGDSYYSGNSEWLLRTSGSSSRGCCGGTFGGYLQIGFHVAETSYGVRPAFRFNDIYNFDHEHTYEKAVTAPTCTEKGYTTYTCECGDSYVGDYTEKLDHEYTSEITTPATHITEGVKTFTCECGDSYTEPVATLEGHTYTSEVTKEATHLEEGETTYTCECGDRYTEAISKLTGHTYEKAVTAPTCTEKGYTTYTCECGDSYVDDYTEKLDHEYTSEITTEPTHLTEGIKTFTCNCGDSYTETVAKLTAHTYEKVATEPTCTTQGYTTYTCACGDSYVDDYVGTKKHDYSSTVTTPATHTKEGVLTYTCSACGDSYTDSIAKTPEHTYTNTYVVAPTCKAEGYTAHVCECGDVKKDNFIEKTGHLYKGRVCENCGDECSCMCHYSGFMAFIWKIINFFYKLFRVNKTCACGMIHY